MDKKLLVIVTFVLISTVCLTKTHDFDCSGSEYNIALVYDCYYNLQLQQDFFNQFLYNFKPLKHYINIIMMTYGRFNLLTFKKLTQENFTLDKFNEAVLQLNTSSCPQTFSMQTVFNDTRDALSGASGHVMKLAIFVIVENLTENLNVDDPLSVTVEFMAGLNVDVKRLFILLTPREDFELKCLPMIFTRSLNNSIEIVEKSIKYFCNSCSNDFSGSIHFRSCYTSWLIKNELTKTESARYCHVDWRQSHLIYLNIKLEHNKFTSQWKKYVEDISNTCQETVRLYRDVNDCNTNLKNGSQVQFFNAFIGLSDSVSNISEDYEWSDGTPRVVDPPWGSRSDGQECVYLSQKLNLTANVICPPGFFKCINSYCIPIYRLQDGVKDCPKGEDELSIFRETTLCTGKLKFTLRNNCLPQDFCNARGQCINRNNDFVCQVPCDTGYVCVSNIVRRETGNDTKLYISFVETTVQLHDLQGSFKFTPQIYSLFELFKLVEVDLSNCGICDLDDVRKSLDSSDVLMLDVSRNSISGHNSFSFIQEMKYLQKLNMSFNKNLELNENFIFPLHLQVLDLSDTKCGSVIINNLINLTCLNILELRNVDPIDLSLAGNVTLDILDVRGTELINIKYDYLSRLSIHMALYTDDFRMCCQVIRGSTIPEDTCHAPRDAISTCDDLIGDPHKRVILWVVGVLSLLGNMVVVIYRIVWDRAVFNKAYGLFVVCLGVSDFIMGVYLIIIAGADLIYRNMYVLEDSNWRHSNTCKLAGILSTFSSETSTMFICLITLDRYLVIKYPFGQHRFSKTAKITSFSLTLILGVVVSVIPVLFPDWKIYSSNGMCLALPFSSGRHTGWEYSAVLFVGLNFVLFIFIAIGQLAIFQAITSYKHDSFCGTRYALRKAQDMSIAKQLFIVAFSDFCCWFPIGIMGIMSLNGFQFNLDVYAWSAVLILPVNSAINPLIYTLPAILRKIESGLVVSKLTSFS